ncbi:hypothetical protein CVT25_005103 [Psilocybe cyanescens]|uniref:4Fe-4S ferredoxin-type domain-containing protein n=1 Tax=Psilocybe cyanescens TaxID=93625 RepID=A0A409XE52_PSICY|nr:hypothetical protein CVT25_005103 [Psilocybe cyanescens]
MKSILAVILVLASFAASSNALVPRQDFCTAVCRPDKPVCPPGQKPTGSEGCWGCCVGAPAPKATPDPPTVCAAVCHEEKPVCPEGEAPTGVEGCWGCCVATISALGRISMQMSTELNPASEDTIKLENYEATMLYTKIKSSELHDNSNMKLLSAIIVVAISMITGAFSAQVCPDICRQVKPACPVGEAPTGGDGCWGCCRKICGSACLPTRPFCPEGEVVVGSTGCWDCCPVPTTP